jgi:hypothetical protein
MAGVKKFLDFFVKVEPEGPTLSDEDLAKVLAEGEPEKAPRPRAHAPTPPAPAPQAAPVRRAPPPKPAPRVAEAAAPAVAQIRPPAQAAAPTDLPDFETIYRAAEVPARAHGYTIDKVATMLQNPRLSGMSASIKANSVLMALEVAGVPIEDVVADAVARDRAIDDFEAWWAGKVAAVESEKRAENVAIEEEMNRYLEAQRERIRGNNAAVQKAQETFTAWKEKKREEERRLYESVQPFVTENPVTLNTGTLGVTPPPAPGAR